ncbi:hypothetical protein HYX17_01335 [Candidatus Woesearchaeota archaeon]|nr:hypothetical protein [Candidatus Woesearchaeota archaeon]
MIITRFDYLLSGLFFLIAILFVINSKANVTGAVIGVPFTATLSSIFSIIFFVLGLIFLKINRKN